MAPSGNRPSAGRLPVTVRLHRCWAHIATSQRTVPLLDKWCSGGCRGRAEDEEVGAGEAARRPSVTPLGRVLGSDRMSPTGHRLVTGAT